MERRSHTAHARRVRSLERLGQMLSPVGGVVHYLVFHVDLLREHGTIDHSSDAIMRRASIRYT